MVQPPALWCEEGMGPQAARGGKTRAGVCIFPGPRHSPPLALPARMDALLTAYCPGALP